MAKKNRIPKKIAGVKVPKPLRKSKMLRSMMASDLGRDVLAKATDRRRRCCRRRFSRPRRCCRRDRAYCDQEGYKGA